MTAQPEEVPYCWVGYTEWVEVHYGVRHWWEAPESVVDRIIGDGDPDKPFNDATCMLPAGHEGPHEWTPDREIAVKFDTPRRRPDKRDAAAGAGG